MTTPGRTHIYAGSVARGDHPNNELCWCGWPRTNWRHDVKDLPAEVLQAERARYGEREED